MRDLTTLFVEASLAKGEWLAALSALQLSATTSAAAPLSTSQPRHLTEACILNHNRVATVLATQGNWVGALAALRCAPQPALNSAPPQTYSSAYLAARVTAYHHVLKSFVKAQKPSLSGHDSAAPSTEMPSSSASQGSVDATALRTSFAIADEAFAVLPPAEKESTRTQSSAATSASLSESSTLPADAAAVALKTAELLRWCQAHLRAAPGEPLLSPSSGQEVELRMKLLQAASKAALQGAVADSSPAPDARTTLSTKATTSTPPDPSADVTSTADTFHATEITEQQEEESASTTPATSAARAELHALLLTDASLARNSWSAALELLPRVSSRDVTPHVFVALVRLLAKRGRRTELVPLVQTYLFPADDDLAEESKKGCGTKQTSRTLASTAGPPTQATALVLARDSVVLKSVAEACRRLRLPHLAEVLLSSESIRQHLTPSAAVPLVMVLRDASNYTPVLRWWAALRGGEQTTHYPLLQHAKLSSYVASCALRHARASEKASTATTATAPAAAAAARGEWSVNEKRTAGWQAALCIFEDAERGAADPALVLLFQLRLLRHEGQWAAAMQLFAQFRARYPSPAPFLQKGTRQPSTASDGKAGSDRDGRSARSMVSPSPSPQRRPFASSPADRPNVMESAFAVLEAERVEAWVPAEAVQQLRSEVKAYKKQVPEAQ